MKIMYIGHIRIFGRNQSFGGEMTLMLKIYVENKLKPTVKPLVIVPHYVILSKLEDQLTSADSGWANHHKKRLYIFRQFQKVLARGKPSRTSNGSVRFVRYLKEQTLTFTFFSGRPNIEMFKEKGLWRVRGERIERNNLQGSCNTSSDGIETIPYFPLFQFLSEEAFAVWLVDQTHALSLSLNSSCPSHYNPQALYFTMCISHPYSWVKDWLNLPWGTQSGLKIFGVSGEVMVPWAETGSGSIVFLWTARQGAYSFVEHSNWRSKYSGDLFISCSPHKIWKCSVIHSVGQKRMSLPHFLQWLFHVPV